MLGQPLEHPPRQLTDHDGFTIHCRNVIADEILLLLYCVCLYRLLYAFYSNVFISPQFCVNVMLPTLCYAILFYVILFS